MPSDHERFGDSLSVSVNEYKEPLFPCPECGKETKPHGGAPKKGSNRRICSNVNCREVQNAPPEDHSPGAHPLFPCRKCGKETKPYEMDKAETDRSRICSDPACRHIIKAT